MLANAPAPNRAMNLPKPAAARSTASVTRDTCYARTSRGGLRRLSPRSLDSGALWRGFLRRLRWCVGVGCVGGRRRPLDGVSRQARPPTRRLLSGRRRGRRRSVRTRSCSAPAQGLRSGIDRLARRRADGQALRPSGPANGYKRAPCSPDSRSRTRDKRDGPSTVNLEINRRPVQQAVAADERLRVPLAGLLMPRRRGLRPHLLAAMVRLHATVGVHR